MIKDNTVGGSREYEGVSAIFTDELDIDMAGAYIESSGTKSEPEIVVNKHSHQKRKKVVHPATDDARLDYVPEELKEQTSRELELIDSGQARIVPGRGIQRFETNEDLYLDLMAKHGEPASAGMPTIIKPTQTGAKQLQR